MPSCIVPYCKISSCSDDRRKSKFQKNIEKHLKITFHKLPRDKTRNNIWLKSLQISQPIPKSGVVCSLHFNEKDFNRTLQKVVLRENAVPTYYPFDADYNEENAENFQGKFNVNIQSQNSVHDTPLLLTDIQPSQRLKDISNHNISMGTHSHQENDITSAEEMILDEVTGNFLITKRNVTEDENDVPLSISFNENFNVLKSMTTRATSMSPEYNQDDKETICRLQALLKEKEQKLEVQQKALKNLKRKLVRREKTIVDLKNVIKVMKKKRLLNKYQLDNLEHIGRSTKDLLKRIINKSTNKSVSRQYSSELRSFAQTLHYYSPEAYEYVRRKFNCCLPSSKTICR